MRENDSLAKLRREWAAFLVERGHKVTAPAGIGCVLVSRNGKKAVSRWLLLLARGKSRTLNRAELEDLRLHLKRAKALNQKAYVVVRFEKPARKLVALSAEKALKNKRILSHKGGIPWND